MSDLKHVERDEWGRPLVYLAEYHNAIYGGQCLFTSADAAIFFVVTGLASDVDWGSFPDKSLRYPNEERTSNEDPQLTPLFCVERKAGEKRVWGKVMRTAAMDEWTVSNGIAEWARVAFLQATGRDLVNLKGEGYQLQGKVDAALAPSETRKSL
jgi:hypothetical protein